VQRPVLEAGCEAHEEVSSTDSQAFPLEQDSPHPPQ